MVFVTHSIDEAVLMGDRIVILSGRPGRVRDIVDVGIGRPRGRAVVDGERFRVGRDYLWTVVMEAGADQGQPGGPQVADPPAGDPHQAELRKEQG